MTTQHQIRSDARFVAAILLALVSACRTEPSRATANENARHGSAPPRGGAPASADDGQWVRPAKDYASTRFSGLTEINAGNVRGLKVIATFSTGVVRGHEAAPIVAGSTMYIVTPFPNIVYALDLGKPGLPIKWEYDPKPELAAQGVACCDVVNRGMVFDQGKVFFNTLDDHTMALDAATGKLVWDTKLGDINLGETITMAPLVVKNRVLVGDAGGEMGVRGWVKALDENTGNLVWTAYGTGPDKDVLIGPAFKPFYAKDRGADLGVSTWPSGMWKIGGGTMWGWISYDSTLDLIYYGNANPGPWNPDVRPGDNKWTSALFARHPSDGSAVWAYQLTPHDLHDYDGVNEQILIDLPINGTVRHVLVRPERNGYVYVMDRATGQVYSAEPYGFVNSSNGVDLATGALRMNPDKAPKVGQVVREICPAAPGVKDWQPSAYSPITRLLYIPHQNLCMDEEGVSPNYIAGTPYVGMNVKMHAGPGGNRGVFQAWNPQTGREVWSIKEDLPVWSGTVVTAGNVAFYGTMDGWFKAVDATTGAILWQFKTGSGIIGQPITYKGPDGHQYVAILSGVGGWAGAIVAGAVDPRDSSAALGFANAMRDLPGKTAKGGMLYVFGL
ncbi:MAG TPA: methanol/ethanol family PQQ-dependent dehydrogenase [Gemmatimonadaceae bacterium]|jgi:PQQ-dependent dehydrogenase (methanol/ethanol family)|nr:methanol/ethanol family PQQ-dependent dehydrogenase [Gemmatimonadaceae bacterium]